MLRACYNHCLRHSPLCGRTTVRSGRKAKSEKSRASICKSRWLQKLPKHFVKHKRPRCFGFVFMGHREGGILPDQDCCLVIRLLYLHTREMICWRVTFGAAYRHLFLNVRPREAP
jgi:hypothetical protein